MKLNKEIPQANDSLVKYYTSLMKQNPKSKLAATWCVKNGYQKHALKFGNNKLVKKIVEDVKDKTKLNKESKKGMKGMESKDNNSKSCSKDCKGGKEGKKLVKFMQKLYLDEGQ